MRRGSIALVTGVALVFLSSPASSYATTRYAAPTGSGTACTQASPCGLKTAVEVVAGDGDEVVVGPGDYNLGFSGLTVDRAIDVHGATGQPFPRILSGGTIGVDVESAGARLANLDVEHGGTLNSLFLFRGTAERLIVHTTSTAQTACALGRDAVLRDSVCRTAEPYGAAVNSSSGGDVHTPQLRNVTAIATGTESYGIAVKSATGAKTTMTGRNVIARGAGPDLLAQTDSSSGVTAAIALDHSNFADRSVTGTNASATAPGSATNQTAAPVFANAATGDFHQLASSPTIDAGTTDALLGALDFDGEARNQGAAPDIGADELPASGGTTPPPGGTTPPPDGTTPPPDGTTPPPDGTTPPVTEPLNLDLAAKKQELKQKIKFFATASADSTLVASGKAIKKTTKQLAADVKRKIKAKLKPAKRERLEARLENQGKATTKIKATATDQSGAEATDKVKVKLKD